MLTAGDQSLTRLDPRVPGLSVVLDPDEVLALATRAVDVAIVDARPTYVRYKRATSCVVGYELTTSDGPMLVYAKAYATAGVAKIEKATAKQVHDERWGAGVMTDERHGVMLAPASNDRDLPALRALTDSARRSEVMRRLLPHHPDLWQHEPQAIRHKPERRWVGVAERDGTPVALIKAYRHADWRRSRAAHRHLPTPGVRPLGWSRRRAALATAWMPGTAFSTLLVADPSAGIDGVGTALAALHATNPTGEMTGDGGGRAASNLGPPARAVGDILPDLGDRTRRLASIIEPLLTDGRPRRCIIHGDFSADQIIVSDTDVQLIDFDQVHFGDPAADLASFAAGLIHASIESRVDRDRAAALFERMVGEYRRCGGPAVRERLAAHLAGALLRIAVNPFRERNRDWPAVCEALITEAERATTSTLITGETTRC